MMLGLAEMTADSPQPEGRTFAITLLAGNDTDRGTILKKTRSDCSIRNFTKQLAEMVVTFAAAVYKLVRYFYDVTGKSNPPRLIQWMNDAGELQQIGDLERSRCSRRQGRLKVFLDDQKGFPIGLQ